MRYLLTVLASLLVAGAAVAIPEAPRAEASSYDGTVRACNGQDVWLRPAEKRTLQLHNQARISRDLPRLCIQQQLQRAARGHSADMIRNNYFSHTSRDGRSFQQRIRQEGYTPRGFSFYRIGENIAGGSGRAGAPYPTHQRWMQSDGHRKNILNRQFRHVGIGVAAGNYRGIGNYRMYTVDFGVWRR